MRLTQLFGDFLLRGDGVARLQQAGADLLEQMLADLIVEGYDTSTIEFGQNQGLVP
jgi:hypothetical protein